MLQRIRWLAACLMGGVALAAAAGPTEDAALAAAEAWAKAVSTRDVDAEFKLLPATMYAKPGERERMRAQRIRDREIAQLNKDVYLSFQMRAPIQTARIGKFTAVVVPYSYERQSPSGKLQRHSSAIALNEEGSSNWSVFDGSGQATRSLKALIPGYNGELSLPPAYTTALKPE